MTDPKPLTPEPYSEAELATKRRWWTTYRQSYETFAKHPRHERPLARWLATVDALRAELASVEGELRDRDAWLHLHEEREEADRSALANVTAERERLRRVMSGALSWGLELGTADPLWIVEARDALAACETRGDK